MESRAKPSGRPNFSLALGARCGDLPDARSARKEGMTDAKQPRNRKTDKAP